MTNELKKAIETVKAYLDMDSDVDSEYLNAQRTIIKALESQWWIPVTERLPQENGRYLVTRGLNACGAMWNRTYIINYSDLMGLKSEKIWWDGNVGKSDFKRIGDVIAWMPLPKPYEPQESEDRE